MNWINFKKTNETPKDSSWINFKKTKETPKDSSWIIIRRLIRYAPKYEVCFYKNEEWYLPANDDYGDEMDIVKWSYIEE